MLHDYLLGLFEGQIALFRDLVAAIDRDAARNLPGAAASDSAVIFESIGALVARGEINARFFALLEAHTFCCDEGLAELEQAWTGEMTVARGFDVLPRAPYKGLEAYTAADAAIFFGRSRELRGWGRALLDPHAPRLFIFDGMSGVGKSSLFCAGLGPRLGGHADMLYARRSHEGLTSTLIYLLGSERPVESWAERERVAGRPLLVVIDQVDEAFEQSSRDSEFRELAELLDAVEGIWRPGTRIRGKLVLAVRTEFSGRIDHYVRIKRGIEYRPQHIEHLDRAGITEVLLGPTRSPRMRDFYRINWDPRLITQIPDDLMRDERSPIAPTLQLLLEDLLPPPSAEASASSYEDRRIEYQHYEKLRREDRLFHTFIRARLDVLGGRPELARHAGLGLVIHVLYLCTTETRTAFSLLRSELLRQFDAPDAVWAVINACTEIRLITEHGEYVRLTHDSLAPVIRHLHERDESAGPKAFRILARRLATRRDSEKIPLLSAAELVLIDRGAAGMRRHTDEERELIAASRRAVLQTQGERRARLMTMAVIVVVVMGTAAAAVWQGIRAGKFAALDRVRAGIALAEAERGAGRHAVAALLALDAHHLASQAEQWRDLVDIDRLLRGALSHRIPSAELSFPPSEVVDLSWSSGRGALLVAMRSGALVWYEPGRGIVGETRVPYGLRGAKVSADGTQVIMATTDGALYLQSGEQTPQRLGALPGGAFALDIREQWIAVGGADGQVLRWPSGEGQATELPHRHEVAVDAVALSPDGLVASVDGNGVMIEAAPGREPVVTSDLGALHAVVHVGDEFVAGGDFGQIFCAHRRGSGAPSVSSPPAAKDPIEGLAFADGRVVSAHRSGAVRFWTRGEGHVWKMEEEFIAHAGSAQGIAADGAALFSFGDDSSLRSWPMAQPPGRPRSARFASASDDLRSPRIRLVPERDVLVVTDEKGPGAAFDFDAMQSIDVPAGGDVSALAASRDGRWRLQAFDGVIELSGAGESGRWRPPFRGTLRAAAVDDSGQWIAASSDGRGEAAVWQRSTGETMAIPVDEHEVISAIAISPDGRWIAVAGRRAASFTRLYQRLNLAAAPIELLQSSDRISIIGFSKDGGEVVAVTHTGVVHVVPMTESLIPRTCDFIAGTVDIDATMRARAALGLTDAACAGPTRRHRWDAAISRLGEHVLFMGCYVVLADGRCVTEADQELRLWIPRALGTEVTITLDEQTITAATDETEDGRHVSVIPTRIPARVAVRGQDGEHWSLSLISRAPVPAIERAGAALNTSMEVADLEREIAELQRDLSNMEDEARARGMLFLSKLYVLLYNKSSSAEHLREAQRWLEAAIPLARAAGLGSEVADRIFPVAERLMSGQKKVAVALELLDINRPWFSYAPESMADGHFVRGVVLSELSHRASAEASWELQRAATIARRIGYLGIAFDARNRLAQLQMSRFNRIEAWEGVIATILSDLSSPEGDDSPAMAQTRRCQEIRLANSIGWVRLEGQINGMSLGDPLPPLRRADQLYRLDPGDCDPQTGLNLLANLAAAACLAGDRGAAAGYRAELAKNKISESLQVFVDKYVDNPPCLGDKT